MKGTVSALPSAGEHSPGAPSSQSRQLKGPLAAQLTEATVNSS